MTKHTAFSTRKIFGGKYYRLWQVINTEPNGKQAKRVADAYAKDARSSGNLARLFEGVGRDGRTVYGIYVREK